MEYQEFLGTKLEKAKETGFDVKDTEINSKLFPFQKEIVKKALKAGRYAIFADCGLGKTAMQLEWARHIAHKTSGRVLILCPLAVTGQTIREGEKFGIAVNNLRNGVNYSVQIDIINYEQLENIETGNYSGIVLDESSILKSYSGKMKNEIIETFSETPYKLACTATPSPNDILEIGNHSQFLNVMPSNEMIARFFINDTMNCGGYRLKKHGVNQFWEWVGSWATMIGKPSDMDFDNTGYELPRIEMHEIMIKCEAVKSDGVLFDTATANATGIYKNLIASAEERAREIIGIVNDGQTWIIWVNTNAEADEIKRVIPDAVEIRGSDAEDKKERLLNEFTQGLIRVLITKPSIAGFGLNWQHCHNVVFFGLTFSYESYYQALKRVHRFGQKNTVNIFMVLSEMEYEVLKTIKDKQAAHFAMQDAMYKTMHRIYHNTQENLKLKLNYNREETKTKNYHIINGDCIEEIKTIGEGAVDFEIFSPPFSNLYIYSDSIRDLGNSRDYGEFWKQFDYLIPELKRILRDGRLCAVHCKNLVFYKNQMGYAGINDFRGDIIRHFQAAGFSYHSEVTIWKDPVIEMQRTKAHGLLYKQVRKDSTMSRQGMAEYLIIFRKWEGDDISPVTKTKEEFDLEKWQAYASPVWMDIRQTEVLNKGTVAENDEKHICPLQLDVIERAVELWTNKGDVVFSPFAGIGSEGYQSILMKRKFLGIELKPEYYRTAVKNLDIACESSDTLFEYSEGAGNE